MVKYSEICNILRQNRDVLDLSLGEISNIVYIQLQSLPIRLICDKNSKEVIAAEQTKFCPRWIKGGHKNHRFFLENKWLDIETLRDYESARNEVIKIGNKLQHIIDKRKQYLEGNKRRK